MAKWLDKYEQGGLVLEKKTKDNYGKKPNVNDVKVSAGPGFEGDGYTAQNWKSPAWGGQFAMGGVLPGAVGFTYARTAGSAPANGKYAKKTKASAQTGISMNVESGTYQPTVTTATKAEIKKSAENAKKEKYYNPKKPTYKSGNKQIDFLASNPWLMDLPIIGDKIKEQAYALGTQKTGSIRTDEDIADPNKIDELRGKYLAGSTNDFSKPLDLVKQYIYADQKLPNSKFTPKDDYYDFLPSYSLQDKLEAPTNESLNMSNFGKENTSYKKGDEIIWNNDGSYFQGDKYKDLMDVVKTHKPKYYNSEKGNLPYDLFYKSGNLVDLAHYKSGFGYDEDVNLPYASISDAWDFYPGDYQKLWGEDKKGEDSSLNTREYQQAYLMHKVGNPYKIYDRTYIDPENKTLVNDKEILAKKQLKKSIDLIPGLTKEQKQKRYEQAWKLTGKSYNPNMKKGGVIKDDMGQWAHPGEVTEIGSNDITMQGVDYPVLGISDTGDTKMMQPGEDYKFDGEKVTEYPMMQEGGWLDKYPEPMRQDATRVAPPVLKLTEREKLENAAKYDQGQKKALVNAKEELAERKKNKATKGDLNTPGSWHTEDKARLSNILPASWAPPGGAVDVFDEYINPATYVGLLTDALGESIAARDPKGIAASLALSAGAGALGLDPLGGAIKTAKGIGKRFFKPSFTSGKEALDFLWLTQGNIGEENLVKIFTKKTGKTREQLEREFNRAIVNNEIRDPEYIIRQANILNGKFNLPNFPKSLKELDEKAGKLVSSPNKVDFDKTEIINRANELLEKGVGIKKKNISVKLESTPGNDITVNVNDNNPYFPVLEYNKSGYISLVPNFSDINTKSPTFTEWLKGKKPETKFVSNWGNVETEPAFIKTGDFPYNYRRDLKGTGIGAEAAEAIKQALEEKGIKLQSSTNHTDEGRLRYLTEFLNDRKKVINTEGNPGWIDAVNNIKESLKGKKVSKEEVQELMDLNPKIDPIAIRFQYKDGGWLMAQNGKWLKKYSQPLILSDATRNVGLEQYNRAKLDQYYKSIDPANQPSISQWNPKPGEVEAQNAREAERVKEYNNWVSKFSRNPHVIKGTKNLGDAGMFAIDAMTLGEGALALNTIAKPIIKAATKKAVNAATNIATKAGTKAATKASSSNYVKDLYYSGKSYATEIAGEQLAGAENRKAIAEGNKWFEDWANHPETAKKIKQQIIDQKTLGKNNPEIFDRIDTPETMQDYRYITTYKPGATEYPLTDQTKDLIKTILGNNKYRTPMVHGDNFGVSYRHGMSKWSNMDDYVPGDRFSGPGTWISRTPAMDQAARKSITIHENTHDWLRSDALERLGFKDEIQKHLTKEAIDSKAKFIKSGYNFRENYLGYLAHETEVHARIMETRLHFGLTPTDKVTSEMAESMLQAIREGKTPINKQFADIFSSPKGAAKLFNKLPAIAPVAVGVGAAATTLPKEQKNGGWLNKYK